MNYCFSTEAVDLDNQAPNRNKRESRYYWDELNHLLSAGGFRTIEIPYEPKWDFGGRSGIPRTMRSINIKFETPEKYVRFLKENGIDGITCIHFNPSLFAGNSLPMYFGAASHFGEEAISFAKEVGALAVTFSVTPSVYKVRNLLSGAPEEEFTEETCRMLTRLSETARKAGICFCLKNEYWGLFRGRKIETLLDLPDLDAKLDLDTANLAIAGADVISMIEANKDRIGVVHLTDTSFSDNENAYASSMPEFPAKAATKVFTDPGEGSVDLKKIREHLVKAGYQGPFIFNPKNSYDVSRSILRTRYYIDTVLSETGREGNA